MLHQIKTIAIAAVVFASASILAISCAKKNTPASLPPTEKIEALAVTPPPNPNPFMYNCLVHISGGYTTRIDWNAGYPQLQTGQKIYYRIVTTSGTWQILPSNSTFLNPGRYNVRVAIGTTAPTSSTAGSLLTQCPY